MAQERSIVAVPQDREVEAPEPEIDADAGHESSRVPDRDFRQGRRPPLTREEEIELARRIEDANRAMLDAVVRSPLALDELSDMLGEIREGTLEAAELTSAAADDERERERIVEAVSDAVRRARASQGRSRAESGARPGKHAGAARAHFVETILEYGLSQPAVERLLSRLAAAREDGRRSGRAGLDATLSAIRESRRASDRAKATFVQANIGLVVSMASKRSHPGMPLHDLVQEGSMGLMRAVEKFDYRRGIRFSTYAAWWVRHSLNRALSNQSRTIRLPIHVIDTRHRVARIAKEFSQELGREPSEAELAHRAGVSVAKIRGASSVPKEPASLDAPIGGGDARMGDFVADPDGMSVLDEISAKHVRHRLRQLLRTLPPREAEVLRLRFGIDRPDHLTLEEVGRMLRVSRERVRQIEALALSRLRGQAAAEDLQSHLAS